MYGSMMDWFNIGAATAPTAGLGNAIRGILDLHTKLSETAGAQMIKSASPLEIAQAKYYASPIWQSGTAPEGYEWGYDPRGRQVLRPKPKATEAEEKAALWNQLKFQYETGQITKGQFKKKFAETYPFSEIGSEVEALFPPQKVNIGSRINPWSPYRKVPLGTMVSGRTGAVLDSFQAPAVSTRQYATNGQQRIYSDDGITWYDTTTGERVQ
jgi:hypothetical protein